MKKNVLISVFLSIVFITGCKTNSVSDNSAVGIPTGIKGVYVLNEGNYGRSNSTLTYYLPDSNAVFQDVFGAVNNRSIGDTGNDIVLYGTKGFIVVNQSNKVEIFSTENERSLGTIQLPNKSPRKIAVANDTKAFVTNWGDNSVSVINPITLTVTKDAILVGSSPEGLVIVGGKVYVCNSGLGSDSTVSVIDASTYVLLKQITVGRGPETIGVDADGDVFVQCSGYTDWNNTANDSPGSVAIIDPTLDAVVATIPLPLSTYGHPGEIAVSKNGYALLKVKNGIAKIDTKTNMLLGSSFIVTNSVYAIAVEDATDNIYVTDAKSYAEDGEVVIYDKNGIEKERFTAGIIPGHIAFKR